MYNDTHILHTYSYVYLYINVNQNDNLVGGFNPCENISQWEGLSHI